MTKDTGVRIYHQQQFDPSILVPDPDRFTGHVETVNLAKAHDHKIDVSVLSFDAGVQGAWHRHAGGQILQVLAGRGYIGTRDAGLLPVDAGDTVVIDPDEEHCHASREGSTMSHMAITIGAITWLEGPA
jgi:quercetin dioxygenase-like cupin family protein